MTGNEEKRTEHEIQLVSDGDGVAVIGESAAVKRYLQAHGLWASSKSFDLRRLTPLLALGSDVAQTAADIAANSGRWIKLTEESARLVEEHGLMDSKTPGESHLMIGVPGAVKSWLQAETGPGAALTNPAVLSGIAGLMAQAARQQSMAEITDYLARIDEKVDDVLRKVDDTVLKDLGGARLQIDRASTMREHEGRVTDDSWAELQNASGKVADVLVYALDQLASIADKLESTTRTRGVAQATDQAKTEVSRWLAVLAQSFQLQDAFDDLALDRALDDSPEAVDARRRGLDRNRRDRLDLVSQCTAHLLGRMDLAVGRTNTKTKAVLHSAKNRAVVASGNHVASGVHEFQELLGIAAVQRMWDVTPLGPVLTTGSRAIQGAKDVAPVAGAFISLAGVAVALGKKVQKS